MNADISGGAHGVPTERYVVGLEFLTKPPASTSLLVGESAEPFVHVGVSFVLPKATLDDIGHALGGGEKGVEVCIEGFVPQAASNYPRALLSDRVRRWFRMLNRPRHFAQVKPSMAQF